MKYVILLLKPLTNASYTDHGSVSAIFDKSCCRLFKLVTSSLTFFTHKDDFQWQLQDVAYLPMF